MANCSFAPLAYHSIAVSPLPDDASLQFGHTEYVAERPAFVFHVENQPKSVAQQKFEFCSKLFVTVYTFTLVDIQADNQVEQWKQVIHLTPGGALYGDWTGISGSCDLLIKVTSNHNQTSSILRYQLSVQ